MNDYHQHMQQKERERESSAEQIREAQMERQKMYELNQRHAKQDIDYAMQAS